VSTLTLVLTAVGSVLLLLFLVMKARMHAFVALMVVSIGAGLFPVCRWIKSRRRWKKGWAGRWASWRSSWRWGDVRQDPA
jgi:Gnt-I system low-affinity gluconate transporter